VGAKKMRKEQGMEKNTIERKYLYLGIVESN
jgi:hypothetical protein